MNLGDAIWGLSAGRSREAPAKRVSGSSAALVRRCGADYPFYAAADDDIFFKRNIRAIDERW